LDGGLQQLGLVVDRLDGLVEYAPEEITPGYQPLTRISPDFILGRAVKNGQAVTLLALSHIIPPALVSRLMERLIPANTVRTIPCPAEPLSSFRLN
jgi:chemotaxis signal transduction protein